MIDSDTFSDAAVDARIRAQREQRQRYKDAFQEFTVEQRDAQHDDDDTTRDVDMLATVMPRVDYAAFYGPLQRLVERATADSEATCVGVGLHALAALATFLRPFCLQIGDERVGLNIFAVQVGVSARGRKGTSAVISNLRLVPGLQARARDLAEEMARHADRDAQHATKLASAKARVNDLQRHRKYLETATPAEVDRLQALVDQHEAEAQKHDERAKGHAAKLQAMETPSPSTIRQYEKAIAESSSHAQAQRSSAAQAHEQLREVQMVLQDFRPTMDRLDADIAAAQEAVTQMDDEVPAAAPPRWKTLLAEHGVPPVVLTGLASGEGVIYAIRDGDDVDDDGDGEEDVDPGVGVKRLLIDLSEFASALQIMRRPGTTLSTVLRDAYDCRPLATNSKNSPVSVDKPFVCMSAAITPAELAGLMFDDDDKAATASNGIGNRPIFAFVARTKLVADPTPTRHVDEVVEVIWENLQRVYAELQPEGDHLSKPILFDESGSAEWARLYAEIDSWMGSSENAAKLHGRMTTNARKLAAILSLINGETTVSAGAVRAAVAWVRYASHTTDVIASTMVDRRKFAQIRADAEAVVQALRDLGADDGVLVSASEVRRKARLDQKHMLAAIEFLQREAPCRVSITEQTYTVGHGTQLKRALLGLS